MVLYDCLNFELISIKTKKIDLFRKTFWCYFLCCVFFTLGNMKSYFVLARFFLKLCAIWIHFILRVINRIRNFWVNVLIVVLRNYCWKNLKIENLMEIKKLVNNCYSNKKYGISKTLKYYSRKWIEILQEWCSWLHAS